MKEYRPKEYWSQRLEENFNLRGTGHLAYPASYNRWLYRAKKRALRRALATAGTPGTALDSGSGVGWVVEQLLAWGAQVEGFDIVEESVTRLSDRYPEATFFQHELGSNEIPRPDDSFDLITAFDVFYHLTDDASWSRAIRELSRVLKPGAVLIATDTFGPTDHSPAAHVRFRSASSWLEQARSAGLEQRASFPLFRWLSRDQDRGALSRLPASVRGPVEYGLELVSSRDPHMRCTVFGKAATPIEGSSVKRSRDPA